MVGLETNITMTAREQSRFWRYVVVVESCWEWIGVTTSKGYGKIGIRKGEVYAHRLAYCDRHGTIPGGMVIDHLCRNRRCVNPSHMRCVTPGENVLALGSEAPSAKNLLKTHCCHGHPLSEGNLKKLSSGSRKCLKCARAENRRSYWKMKLHREGR